MEQGCGKKGVEKVYMEKECGKKGVERVYIKHVVCELYCWDNVYVSGESPILHLHISSITTRSFSTFPMTQRLSIVTMTGRISCTC